MADKRDYYEVLGVAKSATADEIKLAYRKAAMKWHPDRWVDGSDAEKKTAEENFKEASEAYSVLSDPDKKAKYDRFGFAGVDGQSGPDFSGGFGDLNDLLNNLFGGGFGGGFGGFSGFGGFGGGSQSSQPRTQRGRDIRTKVKLTLSEIANGCTKQVSLERNRPCPECGGRGTKNSSDIRTCSKCNGNGQVQYVSNSLFGRTIQYSTCPQCNGDGKQITNPCRCCSGSGVVRKRETVNVPIPAGVEAGLQLTVRGEGHSAPHNGTNGDLFVVIEEIAHEQLQRDGNNLFYSHIISVTDAMLGTEISVPGVDGNYKVKLEPGTQSGTIVKLRGKGLPSVKGYSGGGIGDLYVKIMVWIPRKLSRDERHTIEELSRSESVRPNLSREDRQLFDKEKNIF